jgi:hypothetical protein
VLAAVVDSYLALLAPAPILEARFSRRGGNSSSLVDALERIVIHP